MLKNTKLIDDFISAIEENSLLCWINQQTWDTSLKRRVQHYGYKYDYKARTVLAGDYIGPLPTPLAAIATKLLDFGFTEVPNQVIINEYLTGQGIAPHVDCVPCFGPAIASVSLGSGATMQFSHTLQTSQKEETYLLPRSLLVLKAEARFDWKHGIPARKSDVVDQIKVPRATRVSLTFRTINPASI